MLFPVDFGNLSTAPTEYFSSHSHSPMFVGFLSCLLTFSLRDSSSLLPFAPGGDSWNYEKEPWNYEFSYPKTILKLSRKLFFSLCRGDE